MGGVVRNLLHVFDTTMLDCDYVIFDGGQFVEHSLELQLEISEKDGESLIFFLSNLADVR